MRTQYKSSYPSKGNETQPKTCEQCLNPFHPKTATQRFCSFLCYRKWSSVHGRPKPAPIKYLKVSEARLARRYILALIECRKANIDLSNLNPDEVREQLKTIGTVQYGSGSEKYHQKI